MSSVLNTTEKKDTVTVPSTVHISPEIQALHQGCSSGLDKSILEEWIAAAECFLKSSLLEQSSEISVALKRTLLFIVCMVLLQGCHFNPRYEDELHDSRQIDSSEYERRKKEIQLMINPPDNPPLIRECQIERMMENFSPFYTSASTADYLAFKTLYDEAKKHLNVVNLDRISLDFAIEAIRNATEPEYRKGVGTVLCVVAQQDHEMMGIQALNVFVHKLEEVNKHKKVLYCEAGHYGEIDVFVQGLVKRGVLTVKQLEGLILIGHANDEGYEMDLKNRDLWHLKKQLSPYLLDESLVVLAGCSTGKGEDDIDYTRSSDQFTLSFANQAALCFQDSGAKIISSHSSLIEVLFDANHLSDRKKAEIRMRGIFGQDTTYIPDASVISEKMSHFIYDALEGEVPKPLIRKYVSYGLHHADEIGILHRAGFTPETYKNYRSLFPHMYQRRLCDLILKKVPLELVQLISKYEDDPQSSAVIDVAKSNVPFSLIESLMSRSVSLFRVLITYKAGITSTMIEEQYSNGKEPNIYYILDMLEKRK